jgi:hypothetical protein
MADYYPLLARALDALPDRTPALRKAVYDRARNALISQLRSLDPPLSEADIDLERRALDAAIERLEVDHGGLPAPANDAAREPEPIKPAAPPVLEPEAPPEPSQPELALPEPEAEPAAQPLLPAAEPPFRPLEPKTATREAPIPIAPPRPGTPQPGPPDLAAAPEAAAAEPAVPVADEQEPAPTSTDGGNGRQRPRIEVVPPRSGRSRILRNVFVGTVLAVVIGLIAVAAFLLRDRPQTLASNDTETADTQQPETESKFGDRVGGEQTPAPRTAPAQDAGAPARPAPAPTPQTLAVAQRAELIEEAGGAEKTEPRSTPGRVTWRLDTVNADQGQPLQNAVVATVTIPDAGLSLVMTIQRNLDATLPASHTVSLAFSQSGPESAARVVQDVGLLQAKDEQNARGSPVSGLPVRVRDNLFLIGLSSLQNDVERNTDLLLHRNWFDIALRYTSGRRAVLTFEKGSAGAQVMQSAFDSWQ